MGAHLSTDETCLSTDEVYTILCNKEAHGRKGCLGAIAKGTEAKEVTNILKKIPEAARLLVEVVTLVFSESMQQIVMFCFPKSFRLILAVMQVPWIVLVEKQLAKLLRAYIILIYGCSYGKS